MKVSLKRIIVPSIPLAVLSLSACFALWMSGYIGSRFSTTADVYSPLSEMLQTVFKPHSLVSYLISFAFTFLNAFLLTHLNNRFTLIRTRTFLPILIFLLLMGSWNETHLVNGSHVALTLFILSLYSFLSIYRDTKASEEAFTGSLLIGVASILINPLILLIPICWIGFAVFQSLSLRTLLASIFGVLAPWILYVSIFYYFNPDANLFGLFQVHPALRIDFETIRWSAMIYFALLGIILFITIGGMFSNFHNDAIHTRIKLGFVLLLLITLLLISYLFRNQFALFLPFIALAYSIITAHSFTLRPTNFFGILFLVFCFLNILYTVSKYFPY